MKDEKRNSIVLSQRALEMEPLACKDPTRYNINGIGFTEKYSLATDGHVMAVRPRRADEPNNGLVSIVRRGAKLKEDTPGLQEETHVDFGNNTFVALNGSVVSYEKELPLPDVSHVAKDFSKKRHKVSIATHLLKRVLDVAGKRSPHITFEVSDNPLSPVFYVSGDGMIGAIMPMKTATGEEADENFSPCEKFVELTTLEEPKKPTSQKAKKKKK